MCLLLLPLQDASSKLVFRKRLFRGDEDEIDEMNFIGLSYIQARSTLLSSMWGCGL